MIRPVLRLLLAVAILTLPFAASAQKKYGPGVTDTEILIGQTMPYSGPLSALAIEAKVELAYIDMVNERGGVNGRKIKLISLDDAYSPPKTMEQTRRLIEQDKVLFLFSSLGTPTNTATQRYLNSNKVPNLFLQAGGSHFFDPQNAPWSMSGMMGYAFESAVYGKYVLRELPNAKIAVLYQNDDLTRENVMRQAANMKNVAVPLWIAGAKINTSPTDYAIVKTLQVRRFDGTGWLSVGEPINL